MMDAYERPLSHINDHITQPFQHSTLDARFAQTEARRRLHTFLQLAHSHRDIANWLYSNDTLGQSGDGILSPDTFNRSVATSTLQSYTDLAVNTQPWERGFSEYSENFIYTLYVPVKEMHGVGLGYSFHTAVPRKGNSLLKDIFLNLKTNRGRYVYQKETRRLLILMQNSATTDVLVYVQWMSDSSRRTRYFLIPHRDYGYDDPPDRIICTSGSEADSLCRSTPRPRETEGTAADTTACEESLPNGPADFVDGVWEDNINSLPTCMFQNLEANEGRECSSWLKDTQVSCLARLTGELIQFETRRTGGNGAPGSMMHGKFFSAHVVRDVFNEHGRLDQRKAFEVRTSSCASEAGCLKVLRKAAAQIYYSVVLWASTDQCLVVAQEHSAAKLLIGKGFEEDYVCKN